MIERNRRQEPPKLGDDLPEDLRFPIGSLREIPSVDQGWRAKLIARLGSSERFDREPNATERSYPSTSIVRRRGLAAAAISSLLMGALAYSVVRRASAKRHAEPERLSGISSIRFSVVARGAKKVSVVGDFNQWNPSALPMRLIDDGKTWEIAIPLPPGRYSYAFLVDGRLARDPRAPIAAGEDFGMPNSVLLVNGS